MGLLNLISIHNAVAVVVIKPRMPQVDIGVGWKVRAVCHSKHNGCSGSDVTAIKALNGTVDEDGWNIVEEEGQC